MFRNMSVSLIRHEAIKTTVEKAKELRRVVEPLITLAKNDEPSKRRLAFDRLRDRAIVSKLFNELGKRYQERPGGYVRTPTNASRGVRNSDATSVSSASWRLSAESSASDDSR